MKTVCVVTDRSTQSLTSKLQFEEQKESKHKWLKDTVTYAVIKGTHDIVGDERLAINLAMTTWDIEMKLKLKRVKISDTPDIQLRFVARADDELFTRRVNVLAYAYFPDPHPQSRKGQIVFNDDLLWSMDGKPVSASEYTRITGKSVSNPTNKFKTYNLIHTLTHEIGHSLGLSHASGNNTVDVMDPYYSGEIHLSDYDISRIVARYGSRGWAVRRYQRIKFWLKKRKARLG